MKNIEILVKVNFDYNEENKEIYQLFSFDNSKYINNPGLIVHRKFEDKLIENLLNKNVKFIDMIRESEKIIVKYKKENNFNLDYLKPRFYKILSTVPDNEGCIYCEYKKKDYCVFQNKDIYYPLKNCRFFKQKRIIAS